MIYSRKTFYIGILLIGLSAISYAQKLEKQFDKMLSEQYLPMEPGVTALVAIDGKIIYHKAFGMANLELDVKMEPDMVFEIGSITKQFTSVAILMLMEQGKLNLDDDITNFIEDYPTHGHNISIHHLLTHTSGIKSYTSMESWAPVWRKDFEPKELIDFFKNEPMDFAPGEEWRYNNSAYFILGYIIEKASGQTYEQFIETNIFKPLGMQSSLYGSNSEIIKKRAYGYQKKGNYVNAEYLSLTQPYAAGSLMSTVEDLFIWNRAIRSNKLVKKESIELAFTNYQLNNGEKINYGYGWSINEINESQTVEHAGGIFGYLTNSIYLPNEDVFVAIYSNCGCNGPGQVSTKMAAIAIGKPYLGQEDIISVKSDNLKKLVGVYDFADSSSRIITIEDNQLYSQRSGSSKIKIYPIKKNTFSYDNHFATIQFQENGNEIKAFFANRINKTEGVKTDKPIPVHNEIQLDLELLERYIGVYEINPGFDITITIEDKKLMSQATGQQKFQIFPESQTKFFLKAVDAQIEFIENDNGNFESFILYQGGQEIAGKKKN
ncbi:MAG: serine hydrolase [Bacteroidetes bacterium]|nr:serine hydrolase [Bacteroidota bacterium]